MLGIQRYALTVRTVAGWRYVTSLEDGKIQFSPLIGSAMLFASMAAAAEIADGCGFAELRVERVEL